ncbi:MAG: F0F1 ATP synthase subunit epsilon [Ignavibacteriae bacterium]|nr:F0F1 ATP synthase subunit epsilon [Ignavibacteria bacterium]MBI3364022.1 F0F1 ATP synthase subunit epsilon [Ignavibacteriota bacterium]
MAEKVFKLEIVTPRRVVFSGDVESVSAPGVAGGFQVLYNHAPLLAAIGIGEVKIRDAEGKEARYATSGGFVDVLKNHITMLAETAECADEIDVKRAESAKERATKRLQDRMPETNEERARVALMRAINRLRIAQRA